MHREEQTAQVPITASTDWPLQAISELPVNKMAVAKTAVAASQGFYQVFEQATGIALLACTGPIAGRHYVRHCRHSPDRSTCLDKHGRPLV